MQAPFPPPSPPPSMVVSRAPFSDDFRYGVDPQAWRFVRRSTKNRKQLQCYTSTGAVAGPEGLDLVLSRAGRGEPAYCDGQPLTAPRLQSNRAFLYGTLTVRARLPSGAGLWPAIWMRTPEGAPLNAEIDVVEGFGSRPDLYVSTIHGWSADKHIGQACADVSSTGTPDFVFALRHRCAPAAAATPGPRFDKGFHTFTMDWRPGTVTWSLDGRPYFTTHRYVPTTPMAIVLEVQAGGGFDVAPDDSTRLPAAMTVRSLSYRPWSG